MLERVAHGTGESTHWSIKLWRMDMLKLPSATEAALAEAADAHLILLAMLQSQSLLPWLVDWLEQWARCRQVRKRLWPYGMVEMLRHDRRERHANCRSLPGGMA